MKEEIAHMLKLKDQYNKIRSHFDFSKKDGYHIRFTGNFEFDKYDLTRIPETRVYLEIDSDFFTAKMCINRNGINYFSVNTYNFFSVYRIKNHEIDVSLDKSANDFINVQEDIKKFMASEFYTHVIPELAFIMDSYCCYLDELCKEIIELINNKKELPGLQYKKGTKYYTIKSNKIVDYLGVCEREKLTILEVCYYVLFILKKEVRDEQTN